MRYYKYVNGDYPSFTKGKIYPEDSHGEGSALYSLKVYAKNSACWKEVSEEEYLKQEGKMDRLISGEYYTVKKSGNIFKYDKKYNSFYHIGEKKTAFVRGGGNFDSERSAYRKATKEEIEWLEECNKQDKFIEFDEFKKQMDKKIIGYKLIKPEYEVAAAKLIYNGDKIHGLVRVYREWNILKEAGVLDLWFEPVYEERFKVGDWVTFDNSITLTTSKIKEWTSHSYCILENGNQPFKDIIRKATPEEIKKVQVPDITIKGYKAEFKDYHVSFGCQTYYKEFVLQLGEFLNKSGLKLEHQEEVMKVVEYYKNK